MAIKFQYNKTSLQQLEKQLKVRVRTLPIIKNKESAPVSYTHLTLPTKLEV